MSAQTVKSVFLTDHYEYGQRSLKIGILLTGIVFCRVTNQDSVCIQVTDLSLLGWYDSVCRNKYRTAHQTVIYSELIPLVLAHTTYERYTIIYMNNNTRPY